jgi:processive 1,2-diacylglycerol beta-glucosyltransferase
MTRILVLHAQLGSGHRSAAEALGAALAEHHDVDARVEDALDYVHPLVRRLWVAAYKGMSERVHPLYRAVYAASDAESAGAAMASNHRAGLLSRVFLAHADRLIDSYRPDAVVCTMQFPLQLMSHMRHTGRLQAPLSVVVTDFVPHGSWVARGVAAYYVPSKVTAEGFARKGVDERLLHVTGVPVRLEAARHKAPITMRRRHGIAVDRPLITLFGGGIAPGVARGVVEQLLASDRPCSVVVVGGRNEGLAAALGGLASTAAVRLHRHGAIDFVDDLLAASDLLIGKAGGLTTSEALARGVPMVLIEPIPGQEEWNADFVVGVGAGLQLRTPESAAPVALALLDDPERLAELRAAALRVGRPHAAYDVAAAVLAGVGRAPLERAA